MNDPFKQYFIDSIKSIITNEPSGKSLLLLLKTVSQQLTYEDLLTKDSNEWAKLLKLLKARIHPDKHDSSDHATQLFQDVQIFYDECIDSLKASTIVRNKRKRNKISSGNNSSQSSSSKLIFPEEFSIFTKWSGTSATIDTSISSAYPLPLTRVIDRKHLPAFQAFKCVHARGAIIHQRQITKYHEWHDSIEKHTESKDSVYEIFDSFGGTKELHSVDMIKEELVSSGPVISVSFRLASVYFNQLSKANKENAESAFVKDVLNDVHELMITGWSLTPFGEAWEVEPVVSGNTNINSLTKSILIGFGQFGIDDLCLAPKSNLDHISWQPGPYFDSDFSSAPDWREWTDMDLPITDSELKMLSKCFGKKGFMSGESFVIRDIKKKAFSASYVIRNIYRDEQTNEWIVTVAREDKG